MPYAIQEFHDCGIWQTLGGHRKYPDAASAMGDALGISNGRSGRFAHPLGLRVVSDDRGWKSQVIGGRPNIRILHDPILDRWVGSCTKCGEAIDGATAYHATEFARRHQCGVEPEPVHDGRLIKIVSEATRRR